MSNVSDKVVCIILSYTIYETKNDYSSKMQEIFADIPHNRRFPVVFTPGWEILKKFFFQSA
jgi:hypothetical protein